MKNIIKKIIKEVYPYIVIIISVALIRTFIVAPVLVSGDSMKPNLNNLEMLLIRKIGYNSSAIDRFDIVVIKTINEEGKKEEIIKRIIGLPGEHIYYKKNKLYVNDKLVEEPYIFRDTMDFNLEEICTCDIIPEGKYLVLGDNRPISKDSRTIGLIDEKDIVGKASIRIWPFTKIGSIYE